MARTTLQRLSCGSFLVAGLFGAVSTTGWAAEPAPAIDNAVSPPEMAGVAIPAGQIDRAVLQLDGLVDQIMKKTGMPGLAVAVVENGHVVYAKGFGLRRVGSPEKVDADTVFQLASLSKSVGATVVAREVGEKIVDWDTPVARHLPGFALSDPWITAHVTIGDMYAHRSGLPDHAGDDLEDLGFTRAQILERLRFLPLHSFRDTYAYTNFGLTAAALSVAAAAKTDWASLSEEAIYRPLGMTSTSSRFADFVARPDRAVGHVLVDGAYRPKYQRQPDAQSPAGGVSSSVQDMARWMTMVMQGGIYDGRPIVSRDALLPAVTAEIVASHAPTMNARPSLYGYGFNVSTQASGRISIGHSGAFSFGAGTNFLIIPSANVGIIALSNASPIGAVEALDAMFADLVQYGAITRDWLHDYGQALAPLTAPEGSLLGQVPPATPAPSLPLSSYDGVYANDYFGDARVVRRAGSLMLLLGPRGEEFPLRHWDGNVFAYTPSGEGAPAGSIAKVTFSGTGKRVATLTIDIYAESGKNRFLRR